MYYLKVEAVTWHGRRRRPKPRYHTILEANYLRPERALAVLSKYDNDTNYRTTFIDSSEFYGVDPHKYTESDYERDARLYGKADDDTVFIPPTNPDVPF
jgi:hypothetical protein